MSEAGSVLDWTQDTEGIAWQSCPGCGHRWAFARSFCPKCGARPPVLRQASGRGVIHAVTVVSRAPTEEFRALVPYAIALVDLEEGVRVMAHAAPGVAIGTPVHATFVTVAGRVVPRFEPVS